MGGGAGRDAAASGVAAVAAGSSVRTDDGRGSRNDSTAIRGRSTATISCAANLTIYRYRNGCIWKTVKEICPTRL